MSQARWTMFLVSVPVLSQATQAALSDRFKLKLANTQSQARCVIDSSLGPCVICPSPDGSLEGDVQLVLHSESNSIPGGQFDGGRCTSAPHLVGIVPASLPGLPPALVVHLDSLAFEPRSRPFTCAQDGSFLAESSGSVIGGNLGVSVQGGEFVTVPIRGLQADHSRSRGRVWLDDSGIHVVWALENTIHVRVSEYELGVRIAMRSVIQGDAELPVPTRAAQTGAARGVETRFSPSEEPLLATFAKENRARAVAFPDHMGPLPIRDDKRDGESRSPLPAARLGARSGWYFQFAYREGASGEHLLDGSSGTVLDRAS